MNEDIEDLRDEVWSAMLTADYNSRYWEYLYKRYYQPSEDLDSARNRLPRLSQSAARLSPVPTEPTPPLYRQGPNWSTRGNLLFLIRESRLQLIGNGLCDLTLNREHVDKIAVISLRPYLSICARID
jgi:hypothetical protein